jgi:hypothetical protein
MPGSHQEDIEKLEALLAANPAGRVFTHLAEAYRKAGELDRALAVLNEGLRRHPDYSSAHVVLGRVHWDRGEAGQASAAFSRVLELDPHNLVALRSMADLAREAGRRAEALERYRELQLMDPTNAGVTEAIVQLQAEPDAGAEAAAGGERGDATPPEAVRLAGPERELGEVPADVEPLEIEPTQLGGDAGDQADEPYYGGSVRIEGAEPEDGTPARQSDGEARAVDGTAHDDAHGPGAAAGTEQAGDVDAAGLDAAARSLAAAAEKLAGEVADALDAPLPEFDAADDDSSIVLEVSELVSGVVAPAEEAADDLFSGIDGGSREGDAAAGTGDDGDERETGEVAEPGDSGEGWEVGEGGEESDEGEEGEDELDLPWITAPDREGDRDTTADRAASPDREREADQAQWSDQADQAAPGDVLLTETLGDLYAVQELHDRAAEVYETLLRDRPGDERLRDKLTRVRAAAAGGAADESGARAAHGGATGAGADIGEATGVPSAPDPERIESAWTGGGGATSGGPSPYGWTEDAGSEPGSGADIDAFFRALLSWRPTRGGASEEPGGEPAAAVPERGDPRGGESAARTPAASGGMDEYDFLFGVGGGSGAEPATGTGAGPGSGEEADAAGSAPEVFEEASGASAPGGDESGEPEGDEDLEMFRSWLQSLKR